MHSHAKSKDLAAGEGMCRRGSCTTSNTRPHWPLACLENRKDSGHINKYSTG